MIEAGRDNGDAGWLFREWFPRIGGVDGKGTRRILIDFQSGRPRSISGLQGAARQAVGAHRRADPFLQPHNAIGPPEAGRDHPKLSLSDTLYLVEPVAQ